MTVYKGGTFPRGMEYPQGHIILLIPLHQYEGVTFQGNEILIIVIYTRETPYRAIRESSCIFNTDTRPRPPLGETNTLKPSQRS